MTQSHFAPFSLPARRRWLSASALTLAWMLAPDMAMGQTPTPRAQAPQGQPDAMAQIQQMQRQMEQLQMQIQQMQGGQTAPSPTAQAPVRMANPSAPQRASAQTQRNMAQRNMPQRKMAQRKLPQRKPVAATSLATKEMQNRSIDSTLELAPHVPSMIATKSQGFGAAGDFYIRGMGNTEVLGTSDPAIGMIIDDIYVGRPNFTNFNFFDIERIDVMRGPQGTTGARTSIGGVIDIAFQKPQPWLSGNFEVGYGNYSTKAVRGAINAPVSDIILTQMGVYYNDDKGVVKNTTTNERLNDARNYGLRIATELRPMDALTWNLAINHTYANELNVLSSQCEMFGTPFATPGAIAPCSGRFARTGLRRNTIPAFTALVGDTGAGTIPTTLANNKIERKAGAPTRNTLVSSNIAFDISPSTQLNFITGYIDMTQAYNFDLQDGRPGRSLITTNPTPAIQAAAPNGYNTLVGKSGVLAWSQEARLTGDTLNGAIEYTGGLYYLQERTRSDAADIVLSSVTADRLIKTKTRSYAFYAQTDLHVTANFTFTAGVRYTNENNRLSLRDLRDGALNPIVGGVARPDLRITTANLIAAGLPDRQKSKIFTPRVAMSYALGDDALVYVSGTRGFRPGGWNVRGTDVSTFTTFKTEKAWTYEAGAKTAWLNDALRANLTIFNTDVTDKQVTSSATGVTQIPTTITSVPANYRTRGVETEIQAAPFEGLTMYANLAYQNADYQSVTSAVNTQATACRALLAAGQPAIGVCGTGLVSPTGAIADPLRTPKLSGATGVAVDMPTGMGFVFTPALNMTYAGRWQNDTANVSFFASADPAANPAAITTRPNATGGSGFIAGSRSGNVFLFNASMAVATSDQGWRAVLECENCLNKVYSTSSIAGYSFLNDPMRWTFKVRKNF
jgi:iron complex outermembrane recepter protein